MSGSTTPVIHCPGCGTKMRLPNVDGRIRVTCASCEGTFEWAAARGPSPGEAGPELTGTFGDILGGSQPQTPARPESSSAAPSLATPAEPTPPAETPSPSRHARILSGILMVAVPNGVLLTLDDVTSPLIWAPAFALSIWGMYRIYRGVRPRGGGAVSGRPRRMHRLTAVTATLAIAWASNTVGVGTASALLHFAGYDVPSHGGWRAGPDRADRRLDSRLGTEAESQLEAARAAAAQAATATARAAAVDAFSEAAETAAFADDLDALERILEEQIAVRGGR